MFAKETFIQNYKVEKMLVADVLLS